MNGPPKARIFTCGHQGNQGFTLIEMLVAITVFSIILVLLSGSFYLADRSREASRMQLDELEGLRQTQALLDRYLGTMQAVWQRQDDDKSLLFHGREDSVVFVSAMPAHLGESGLYEIRLSIIGEAGKRRLQFERQLLHPQRFTYAGDEQGNEKSILMDKTLDLAFSYFGAVDKDLPADWYDSWPSSGRLPALVRLSVRQASGDVLTLSIRTATTTSGLSPSVDEYVGFLQAYDG